MEIQLSADQELKLAEIASKAGTAPEQMASNLLARYLDEEARFLTAVEEGLAAANRGEFIEEEEMDARVAVMFKR